MLHDCATQGAWWQWTGNFQVLGSLLGRVIACLSKLQITSPIILQSIGIWSWSVVNFAFPIKQLIVINFFLYLFRDLVLYAYACRHGIRQLRSGWADGPSYITQCPIQTGQSYVYNYTVVGQRGTLFWHAHISWLRASVYGPLIILPKLNVPYPFIKPYKEVPIIFGN